MVGMVFFSDSTKKLGAAPVGQISHFMAWCVPGGGEMQGVSPSGFASRSDVAPFTIGLTLINRMVTDFAHNVGWAAEAGFDGGIF